MPYPILEQMETQLKGIGNPKEKQDFINAVKELLFRYSDKKQNPVDNVIWVNFNKVEANDYNPNAVAKMEMKLLYTSIQHDGYTQPIVTIYDAQKDKYVIVDGFHRYATMVYNKDLQELNNSQVPIVVINKSINDRMASTIRHNRARGKHSVDGMSNIVLQMLKNGWEDAKICNELGLEPEELVRYKYTTGFAKLYKDKEYSNAWETTHQIRQGQEYRTEHPEDTETYTNYRKEH